MPIENLTQLRAQLLARKAVLHDEVRAGLAKARTEGMAQEPHDLGDESLADVAVDTALADVRRDINELRDVESALRRMESGVYGICQSCKSPIGAPRLNAHPTAKRCLRCETALERHIQLQTAYSL
jgi:RNA polymerase-binding protein DksA